MKFKLFLTSLALFFLLSPASSQAAVTPPAFPACPQPGGSVVASYLSGTHGIPGDSGNYSGSDSVHQVSPTQLVQCFCPDSGNTGIQTNWWQVDELSQQDIDYFKSLGWVFVPNGSAWGLSGSFYFAYNINYDCRGGGGGGFSQPGPGPAPVCTAAKPAHPVLSSVKRSGTIATLSWTKINEATHYAIWYGTTPGQYDYGVPNTGNVTTFTVGSLDPVKQYYWEVRAVNDCMPSDPAGIGGGQVLGAFAQTGNAQVIFSLAALGLIFFSLSLYVSGRTRSQA